jgi:2-haloacid dehalogenase
MYDLNAARDCGMLTGFIYRPTENGRGGKADKAKQGDYDVVATDMLDLASQLGV